jgi:octaprenyl-diphosphate synthase
LRRGRPTANAHFGNASSVLVGDFIYTRAFQLMVQLANMELLDHMADTTNVIAEGEVLQLVGAGNPSITEAQYLEVIERKTAALFAAACKGPAILRGHPVEVQEAMENYGRHLGIAFQMIDDVLDYTGDPETTGKQVGDDLNEGKPTLPLIHTMTAGSDDDSTLIKSALSNKSSEQLDEVIAAVKRSGGIDYTQNQAQMHRQHALSSLNHLPDSSATSALAALADLAIDRQR